MEAVYWLPFSFRPQFSCFFFFLFLNPNSTSITGKFLVTKHGSISIAAQCICHTCLLKCEFTRFFVCFFFHLLILTLSDHVSLLYWNIMNACTVPCATTNPGIATVCEKIYIFFYFLWKRLKWPSFLSGSVRTAIFTLLKSLLKPHDKSRLARHKSHCQKRPLPSLSLRLAPSLASFCAPLALFLLVFVSLPAS